MANQFSQMPPNFSRMETNYKVAIARGKYQNVGVTAMKCDGRNDDIDTVSAPEDVWYGGGEYTGQPATGSPETVEISSSSANDAAAGTGARTVRIFGLKSAQSTSYETEEISLDGTNWVASTNTWWRVNYIKVLTGGSGGINEGTITCRHTTTTANVFAVMPALQGETHIAAYTVPARCELVVYLKIAQLARANGAAGSALISLRAREPGGVYVTNVSTDVTDSQNFYRYDEYGEVFPAGTDLKWRVDSVTDNNTIVTADMRGVLIKGD